MKVLLLYDYPPPPGGLATQGDLLYRGLCELGVDAHASHFESPLEKEWYYRWFKPDLVVGIGYWGHAPHIILHPQRFNQVAVPWLVADGFIANYQRELNELPLILVTSNWVKEMYIRDGVRGDNIEVLPVGCDTDQFTPIARDDPKVSTIREMLALGSDQVLILTVGGDAASKGAQEVMMALAGLVPALPAGWVAPGCSEEPPFSWKYVCKVWPQRRTQHQNKLDLQLAKELGIANHVAYYTDRVPRSFMPYLYAACDIYAAPSRLEGFGMPQVEAGACGKPVVSIAAMALLDTLVHGETALLAGVATANYVQDVVLGADAGYRQGQRIVFETPRIGDYRADVGDLRRHIDALIQDAGLRKRLGEAARKRVVEHYDYRLVARRFLEIVALKLGIG